MINEHNESTKLRKKRLTVATTNLHIAIITTLMKQRRFYCFAMLCNCQNQNKKKKQIEKSVEKSNVRFKTNSINSLQVPPMINWILIHNGKIS